MKNTIKNLRNMINYYNKKYFIDNDPEISDEEFDQLFNQLKQLEIQYPEFDDIDSPTKKVGLGSLENTFEEVLHKTKMLSLGKCLNFEEFKRWINKLYVQGYKKYTFECKIDGLAISLWYDNGKLTKAVTRGGGDSGEDITASILMVADIPKQIKDQDIFEVRGEVYLPKSNFAIIQQKTNNKYQNVRNAASGLARSKKPTELNQYLNFAAYTVLKNQYSNNYTEDMDELAKQGFTTVRSLLDFTFDIDFDETKIKFIDEKFKELNNKRQELDFDIDGIVIKVDNYKEQEQLGFKVTEPNWATAFKFDSLKAITTLLGVENLLGAKGNITPRSVLEPVEIGGTIVTKPTLHNYDEIRRLNLKIGDKVLVSRQGDVIPKILKCYEELRTGNEIDIIEPEYCPVCHAKLVYNPMLRCENLDCEGLVVLKICNFVKAMEIEDFAINTIEKVYEIGLIKDMTDIFSLTIEQLETVERLGRKSATNIVTNIQNSKQQSFDKVLSGLTIKGIGVQMAKNLAIKYPTLSEFQNAVYDDLTQIDDIGEVTEKNIKEWIVNNQQIIEKLLKIGIGTVINSKNNTINILNAETFAFTGALTKPRSYFESLVEENGGQISSIKKGLNYLVIGNGAVETKINKAEQYGAKVISEETFLKLLKL